MPQDLTNYQRSRLDFVLELSCLLQIFCRARENHHNKQPQHGELTANMLPAIAVVAVVGSRWWIHSRFVKIPILIQINALLNSISLSFAHRNNHATTNTHTDIEQQDEQQEDASPFAVQVMWRRASCCHSHNAYLNAHLNAHSIHTAAIGQDACPTSHTTPRWPAPRALPLHAL